MKRWPRLSELFAIHPFADDENTAAGTLGEEHKSDLWQKIKFDNTVRAWIAGPTFGACYLLWIQHAISAISPIVWVFGSYAALQFLLNWYFLGSRHGRTFDFVFSGLDLTSMSMAIYLTGAANSPLYFLYFIPLIVHAFHRDSTIVMFSGFGGLGLYAGVILCSMSEINATQVTDLVARLFFMLLTVSVACLAIVVLRRKDQQHRQQINRLESQTRLSEMLNQVVTFNQIGEVKKELEDLITEGLAQAIRLSVCLDGNHIEMANQTGENSREHSGISIPMTGSENESFGELTVQCYGSYGFKREEMVFLRFVARSMGLAIQRVLRMEELRKSLEMNSCVMAATIASVRSVEDTCKTVIEGILTVLEVQSAELLLWSEPMQTHRRVYKTGIMMNPAQQLTFPLKTLQGENLGEIRVERSASALEFEAHRLEIAATFATRASLAIENALAHNRERHPGIQQAA